MPTSIREHLEANEQKILAARAQRVTATRGRERPEPEDDMRTAFQRDRDRILHSNSFRRLKHKTQVFLAPEGDHYRTRMTHTLEVSQVARTMARCLSLNEDLTEAMALGHDLGHTPFGHAGEHTLAHLAPGGFHHARQSVRVVEQLEKDGAGLNLTFEVRDGILKHSKGKGPILSDKANTALTLEGQVVRIADIVAYVNHDLEDAIRAQLVRTDEIPLAIRSALGESKSERLRALVLAVVEGSPDTREKIGMNEEVLAGLIALRDYLYEKVYDAPIVKGEFEKAERVLVELWNYFHSHTDEFRAKYWLPSTREEEGIDRAATDFIAGMTDRYALRLYEELLLPRRWAVY